MILTEFWVAWVVWLVVGGLLCLAGAHALTRAQGAGGALVSLLLPVLLAAASLLVPGLRAVGLTFAAGAYLGVPAAVLAALAVLLVPYAAVALGILLGRIERR